MTPTRYQSGETDYSGRISRNGDGSVRTVLYEAGHLILTRPLKGCTVLKSWATRIAKRAGMKKAAVALARKLAVIMRRIPADGTPFTGDAKTSHCKDSINRNYHVPNPAPRYLDRVHKTPVGLSYRPRDSYISANGGVPNTWNNTIIFD
jgi:Transposase IS116/IS110/IS902 family